MRAELAHSATTGRPVPSTSTAPGYAEAIRNELDEAGRATQVAVPVGPPDGVRRVTSADADILEIADSHDAMEVPRHDRCTSYCGVSPAEGVGVRRPGDVLSAATPGSALPAERSPTVVSGDIRSVNDCSPFEMSLHLGAAGDQSNRIVAAFSRDVDARLSNCVKSWVTLHCGRLRVAQAV